MIPQLPLIYSSTIGVFEDIRRSLISRMRKNHVLIVHQDIQQVYSADGADGGSPGPVKVIMKTDPKRPNIQRVFTTDLFIYSGGRDANSGTLIISLYHPCFLTTIIVSCTCQRTSVSII
jgi:hypothetical protein